ncbi:glucuronyl hydrolase [Puteibacter caeruleilacunae]|nr:glucuronyl hydrolase [Puteibacter caeruleilacunae]
MNWRFLSIAIVLQLSVLVMSSCDYNERTIRSKVVDVAEAQYTKINRQLHSTRRVPKSVYADGRLKTVDVFDWTGGFFAGSLWYLYELSEDDYWKGQAVEWTKELSPVQYFSGTHDVGFIIGCSYGVGYRMTHNKDYEAIIIQTAESLLERYNANTECVKSWNYRQSWDNVDWFFPVIVDNMVTLEVLFKASELTGNLKYRDVAIKHANTTIKNHYRSDYSSYHVVNYDGETGEVLHRASYQGYADESSWSRGQAWGLYGFVMCYRETGEQAYLRHAEGVADYIISNLKQYDDLIPYWDFRVNDSALVPEWDVTQMKNRDIPKDASSASIVASALLELSTFSSKGEEYSSFANDLLEELSKPGYLATSKEDNYFILKHSVGSVPHDGDVDRPSSFADYYFLEALCRRKELTKHKKINY